MKKIAHPDAHRRLGVFILKAHVQPDTLGRRVNAVANPR
jgi:hypothetical protein